MRIAFSRLPRQNASSGWSSFVTNFMRWATGNGHRVVRWWQFPHRLIVLAHFGDEKRIRLVKRFGCRVIHRLDEHFDKPDAESEFRRQKHLKIRRLNKLANITAFQSDFVRSHAVPFLGTRDYVVIHNGSDPQRFFPAETPGDFVGHVTWGLGPNRGLDRLRQVILARPDTQFLLAGRQAESELDFNLPNVRLLGPVANVDMPGVYHQMKALYFPSVEEACPNTVIEAILSGVPVCYHPSGGTLELVADAGEPLDRFDKLLADLPTYRARCLHRPDLHFDTVARRYMEA